jgi:hypothetical protein
MQRLQPCPRCGAQFDVSAMAAGSAFTCGACGAVVTAGAAPATPTRVPPAPVRASAASRPIPAPVAAHATATASRGASGRGPQYVPVERHRDASSSGSRRNSAVEVDVDERGSRRERGRDRGGAPAKKRLSTAALAGIGGGVLALVVVLFLVMGKKEPTKTGGGGTTVAGTGAAGAGTGATSPSKAPGANGSATAKGTNPVVETGTPAERLAAIESDMKGKRNPTNADLESFFERLVALGAPGEARAKEVAREIVQIGNRDYAPARRTLGFKEFKHEVPEIISFEDYPYIRAVQEANKTRWFDDDEAYGIAMKAWEKTEAHAKKLDPDAGDRTFRALDGARRLIARDKHFKDYNYEAIFARPYLICYSSDERLSEEDFLGLSKTDRQKKLAELEKKRHEYRRILAEKARIYQQLYDEFLKRYGEACNLKNLMDEYGGRGDLPLGKRSYKDGCPLIIWIFSDKAAFKAHHTRIKEDIHDGVAGYFSPLTGWVYLYDETGGGTSREFEINKNVHEGTHQLEHWFQKQKREWGQPVVPQSFFGEGFAEYLGAVNMKREDRTLEFHGLNRPRLLQLQGQQKELLNQGKKMHIFPTKELVGFQGYGQPAAYALQTWSYPQGLLLFYGQSWAFVYFLNEFQNHKYQPKFKKYLDDMLNHPPDGGDFALKRFKDRFGIRSEEDWKKMHKEFETFYLETLLKKPLDGAPPPDRDDWPGYVPVDPVDPTKN